MKADPLRLAWLFREAGMMDEAAYEECLRDRKEKPKTLVDILKTEVTIKGIRDLLTTEIELPFIKKNSPEENGNGTLHRALSQPLYLSQDEIKSILTIWKPPLQEIAARLSKEPESATPETAPSPEEAAPSAKPPAKNAASYDRLIERGMLKPEALSRAIAAPAFQLRKINRLRLALNLLRCNGILEPSDCEEIFRNVLAKGLDRIPVLNDEILAFIQSEPELPTADLQGIALHENLRRCLPVSVIRQNLLYPLRRDKSVLELTMADPFDFPLVDTLSLLTGVSVVGFYAPATQLIRRIQESFADEAQSSTPGSRPGPHPAQEPMVSPPRIVYPLQGANIAETDDSADNYSAVELVSSIIEGGIQSRATDIHLEPLGTQMRVRYRIDGRLRAIMHVPPPLQLPVISRIKVLSNLDVTERRRPQDGHFSLKLNSNAYDFRVSTLPTHLGEKVVVRILDAGQLKYDLEGLGMEKNLADAVRQWISRPHGLVLVTGPTGCGKTSTLYAALNTINNEARNIVTIEDPVEYQLQGINQVQVDPNIEMGFAMGLRAILRQDPDVIMVGEIRDQETARIALRAALTGHLVFSTLHTNTAAGAIASLRQMGIEPYMLVSALSGVISQRLVRLLCPKCKASFSPNKELLLSLGMDPKSRKRLYRPKGCDACINTGYRGRTGIFELLPANDAIKAAILENKSEAEITAIARQMGAPSLFDNALLKLAQGITSPQEVLETLEIQE